MITSPPCRIAGDWHHTLKHGVLHRKPKSGAAEQGPRSIRIEQGVEVRGMSVAKGTLQRVDLEQAAAPLASLKFMSMAPMKSLTENALKRLEIKAARDINRSSGAHSEPVARARKPGY